MWLWTLDRLQHATDADGGRLYQSARQGVTFPLADALCWLLAARCQILDVLELEQRGADDPSVAEGLPGLREFHDRFVPRAIGAGQRRSIAHLRRVGLRLQPASAWDEAGTRGCFHQDELDSLEDVMPGIGSLWPGRDRE